MRHLQPLELNHRRDPGLNRRTFLRLTAATSVGLSALLEACGTSIPSLRARQRRRLALARPLRPVPPARRCPPTSLSRGPSRTCPVTTTDSRTATSRIPRTRSSRSRRPPGLGTDVTAMTRDAGGPPPPLDQNAAWQAVNKQLNANMKLQIISPADYQARVATVMAGGKPPDLMYFMTGTQVTPGLPDYLKASFADLGPYLAGDADQRLPESGRTTAVVVEADPLQQLDLRHPAAAAECRQHLVHQPDALRCHWASPSPRTRMISNACSWR